MQHDRRRETLITALLSLNFGLVFLDRNALNYLMPFVAPELRLDNTRIGILAAATAISWALSGLWFSSLCDRFGKRRTVLAGATVAFSLMSIASGFAHSFAALLLLRLVMGFAEGPVLPVSQAVIATEASPQRRGLLMGVMNNLGSNLLGVLIAPPLLVAVAQTWTWRAGFWIAGLPGLFSAVLIWWLVRDGIGNEAGDSRQTSSVEKAGFRKGIEPLRLLARSRNIWLCTLIACCMLAWTLLGWAFLPIYFIEIRHFAPDVMGKLMAVLGASAVAASILVPALSDRYGRKPLLVVSALIAMVPPLAVGWSGLSALPLAVVLFLGWLASGSLPLFMATVPSESVPPALIATAMALVMGTGEVVGGAIMPIVAGMMADSHGLAAVLAIQAGSAALAALLALFVTETAPVRGC